MYLNFSLFPQKLKTEDLFYLLAIKQIEKEILISIPEDSLSRFKELNLIKYINGAKKEDEALKVRLSENGNRLMSNLSDPPVEEQDEKILNWLCDHYKKLGKESGNKKKTARHIRDFRLKSNIEKNNLIKLCLDFLNDDENMDRSRVLEYIFYYPKTVFATKFDIEESWLYRHYLKKEDYFKNIFEEY